MWGRESSGEELDKVIAEEKEKKLTKKDKELRLEKEAPYEWSPMYKKKDSNSRKFEKNQKISYGMGPRK